MQHDEWLIVWCLLLDVYNGHEHDEHMDTMEAQRYKQVKNFHWNLLLPALIKTCPKSY